MEAGIKEATIKRLGSAINCLIILPQSPTGDALAAALALRAFLIKQSKETEIVSPSPLDKRYGFLPGFESVSRAVEPSKNLLVEVSTKNAELDELSYNKEPEKLTIFLKPKDGIFEEKDVSVRTASFPFDLVITVGISSLEHLGDFYANNTDVFFNLPIVNIDYRATNEGYGQFNAVDVKSTSCSEVVFGLISAYEESLMDEAIATALLAGIISESNSFQHSQTTPQTLVLASRLIELGAKQQEIVNRLYRTKSMSFLRLWGRALARIKQDSNIGLVYTLITQSDFEKAEASNEEAEQIITEMGVQLKMARILLVLFEEKPNLVRVFCQLPPAFNPMLVFGGLSPKIVNSKTAAFQLNTSLLEAERLVVELVSNEANRLAQ
jgi:nanoRNase/pAp phosphatase (c-di-AMP/oligoRNAs hydrolase)